MSKKSGPSIGVKHTEEFCILSLSITLSYRQRVKMGWLRTNVNEYLDSMQTRGEGPVQTTRLFNKKTKEYQYRVIRQAISYQNYLNRSRLEWTVGKSVIHGFFFTNEEIKINRKKSIILFPSELDFGEGYLNYFSFDILKDIPENCLEWVKLTFVGDFIFCEIKTHPYNIDWDELAKFDLYEVGLISDSLPNHAAEEKHWLPV